MVIGIYILESMLISFLHKRSMINILILYEICYLSFLHKKFINNINNRVERLKYLYFRKYVI